jgi:hypothetical protein
VGALGSCEGVVGGDGGGGQERGVVRNPLPTRAELLSLFKLTQRIELRGELSAFMRVCGWDRGAVVSSRHQGNCTTLEKATLSVRARRWSSLEYAELVAPTPSPQAFPVNDILFRRGEADTE